MAASVKYPVDERHREWADTAHQKEVLEMRLSGMSVESIGQRMGVPGTNITRTLKTIFQKARDHGYDPAHDLDTPLPGNQLLAGVTNRYKFVNGKRQLSEQYVLGRRGKNEDLNQYVERIEAACSSIKPCKPVKSPRYVHSDLCNLLHCTDYHLAMYAAVEEGGDEWNEKIAQSEFVRAITELVESAPMAGTGIFSQGGDFLHYDSMEAVTPAHKHNLDASTRAFKMVGLALDMHIFAIEHMLKHHRKVIAIIQEGNHDPMSSIWLRKALTRYFAHNKRVEVMDVDFPYYAYLHGDILLAFHHGHKTKNKELPALFASEPRYRHLWGKAKYAYIHVGHQHRREQDQAEFGGAVVERHPTLAARDAYASAGGWVSWRAMNCITYHKEKGEVSRRTTVPSGP
jgi:hypothetical protein